MKKTLNIAHRGFSGKYPENTLIAFEKAVAEQCGGFETDVHLTKDNLPVIIHDARLERTTDGTGFIRDHTYNELLRFNMAHLFVQENIPPQRLLLLDEVLELAARHKLFLNIELKNYELPYEGLEQIVLRKITEFHMEEASIISSFNHLSLEKCRSLNKKVKTGYLYSYPLLHMDEYVNRNGGDAIHPQYRAILFEPDLVEKAHAIGAAVNTWTVNEAEDMEKMLELGVDAIITNYPDLLNQVMNGKG